MQTFFKFKNLLIKRENLFINIFYSIIPILIFIRFINFDLFYRNLSEIDPDYQYLLNFLDILLFEIPKHRDHPGLPLDYFWCFNNKNI